LVFHHIFWLDVPLAGPIDMIQVRRNRIYIMDFKPEAKKQDHAKTQLRLYATALSTRARIDLSRIVCAWFDENEFFEF